MRRSLRLTALTAGLIVLVAGAPVQAQDRDSLGADLDTILADPGLAGADVGLVVTTPDGDVVYQRAPERRRQPASNAKLATSAAALEVLGPDHTFTTTVATPARRTGAVLNGNLYLKGTGDPTMLAADYDALAATVAATGTRVVTGNLTADDTWFDDIRLGLSWAWDDEPYYYNAQVSALTVSPDEDFDAGSIIVRVAPGAAGQRPTVTTDPPTNYVRVVNNATTGPAGSSNTTTVDRVHGTNTFTITGSIPAGASAQSEWMAVWEPTGYAAALFRASLQRHGVTVLGPTVRAATPSDARVLATRESIPLSELQVPFLKLSNNLHAEILVKSMGREVSGKGSWDAGRPVLVDALTTLGVTGALSMADGSGLSRMDQISPAQLAQLLSGATTRPWFPAWFDALPVAGNPDRLTGGTLRSRMAGTAAEGNVHAKTGSLTGVTGLSGYVDTAGGERLVFSMLTNNTIGINAKTIEDRVAVRLAQEGGDTTAATTAPRTSTHPQDLECSWLKAC